MQRLILILTLIVSGVPQAPAEVADSSALSEASLVRMFREQAAAIKSSEARQEQAALEESLRFERYQPQLYAQLQHANSSERPLIVFQPTLSPSQNLSFGIRKNFSHGLSASTEAFAQQLSTPDGSINNATQFGQRAQLSLDLWRNFMGKLDDSQLNSLSLQKTRTELQTTIEKAQMEFELRKAFWTIVALEESLKVADELIQSGERQLKEARLRQRDGIADEGEIARYQAQIESRQASRVNFEYQRETIIALMMRQLPALKNRTFAIQAGDLRAREQAFQVCAIEVLATADAPLDYAPVQRLMTTLRDELTQQQLQADRHGSADLFLSLSAQRSSVDQSYASATSSFVEEGKQGYAIGLSWVMPIGDESSRSQKLLLSSQKKAYEAQKISLEGELVASHSELRRSLQLLDQAMKRQANETRYLDINLKSSQRKFNQGRIPLSNLIMEQDALFSSRLNEIDLKRRIIHALYDYFKVFIQHPCSLNRVD